MIIIIIIAIFAILVSILLFSIYLENKEIRTEKETLKTLEKINGETPVTLKVRNFKLYYEVPSYNLRGKFKEVQLDNVITNDYYPELRQVKIKTQETLDQYKKTIKTVQDLLEYRKSELEDYKKEMNRFEGNFD